VSEHGEEIDGPLPLAMGSEARLHREIERIALALESAAEGDFQDRLPRRPAF